MSGMPMMEVPAVPKGARLVSVDGRTYPLQSARIAAEASGGIVRSTLVQSYRNPYDEALEVVYTMPLPADGAVIGYTMRLGERVIRGEVRPRAQAREDYEKALFEGRSAGLLEQERDDTFTQRLGSLPARTEAQITIEVLHALGFIAGSKLSPAEWEYRFPTVVSVRYQGEPGRVPDADRLDVDRAGTGEIAARIELTLDVKDGDRNEVHRVESMRLDRDIAVRWPAGQAEVGLRLVEGPGLPGDSGRYGVLTITPPAVPQIAFSRDLTILIDTSGSMSGEPIGWAKRVTKGLLESLGAGDTFELIAFGDHAVKLTKGSVPATAAAGATAISAVDGLSAEGGTEMASAIVEALRPLRAESQRQVVLITDGQIGMEDVVVRRVRDELPAASRLHVVGIGAAPNRTLTARASRAGRGIECFACGDHQVDTAMRSIVAATARPVLTDLRVGGNAIESVAPARPRDVMAGQPVTMAIELARGGGRVHVSGSLAGAAERWTCSIDVPPIASRGAISPVPIGALYGREVIADLEVSGREETDRVEHVAMRHRIVSRATSLVAISEEPSVDPRQPRRVVELPVEVPAFQSAEALGLMRVGRAAMTTLMSAEFDEAPRFRDPRGLAARIGSVFQARRKSPEALKGRVIHAERDLIVVEYETPSDGFIAPEGAVLITNEQGQSEATISDRALSSPTGPHPKGVRLRMALRRIASPVLTTGEAVTLSFGA